MPGNSNVDGINCNLGPVYGNLGDIKQQLFAVSIDIFLRAYFTRYASKLEVILIVKVA